MRLFLKVLLLTFVFFTKANAGDLEWGGAYRIEGNIIENPQAKTGDKKAKEYGVHHLILRPRIVAADGLYINSQFHLLNGNAGGPQLGSVFGNGVSGDLGNLSYSSADSDRQEEETFAISEFYLTYAQEFGSLIVGRAPLHFGLGMTYNAGKGAFDHFYDNRDLVGYKVVMGNFYFMPMIAKVKEGGLSGYDDISETLVQVQYESAETNTAMGFMYANRRAGTAGNDTAVDAGSRFAVAPYNSTGTYAGKMDLKTMNIFYTKTWDKDRVGFEIVNQTGDHGVQNASSEGISQSAFAVAFEYARETQSKTNWGVKLGWASGDDPNTDNEYEGYSFDQNYDVAALLFNHTLGQYNMLGNRALGVRYNADRNGTTNVNSALSDPDIEAISNVMYFAPYVTYKWSDDWTIRGVLATAYLDQDEFVDGVTGTADADLGYEFDISLNYSPYERLLWENTFAYFAPGGAFELGGSTNATFGVFSRATISF